LIVDHGAYARVVGFDHRGASLHHNPIAYRAHLQNAVNGGIAVDLQDYAGLFKRTESLLDHLNPVGPDGHAGEHVPAIRRRCSGTQRAGGCLGRSDFRVGNYEAARIPDCAVDLSGSLGRKGGRPYRGTAQCEAQCEAEICEFRVFSQFYAPPGEEPKARVAGWKLIHGHPSEPGPKNAKYLCYIAQGYIAQVRLVLYP
jgi:hypothetical protein